MTTTPQPTRPQPTTPQPTTSQPTADTFIDPTFLFRFEIEIRADQCAWSTRGLKLPEKCRLPSFGELADRPTFAELRAAWCPEGLGFWTLVSGKRQTPWCRDSRPEVSDSLHVWIDTRCSPGIHRATQYCHRFAFLPTGGGSRRDQPLGVWMPINRARANPKIVDPKQLKVVAHPRHDGYELSAFLPASQLTGYDPSNFDRLSLSFAVIDCELGWQTFSLGNDYPFAEDPSLWGEAKLVS
jgi:hypothetical protein